MNTITFSKKVMELDLVELLNNTPISRKSQLLLLKLFNYLGLPKLELAEIFLDRVWAVSSVAAPHIM